MNSTTKTTAIVLWRKQCPRCQSAHTAESDLCPVCERRESAVELAVAAGLLLCSVVPVVAWWML